MSISGAVVNDPVWNAFRKCTWERMDDENRLNALQQVCMLFSQEWRLGEPGVEVRLEPLSPDEYGRNSGGVITLNSEYFGRNAPYVAQLGGDSGLEALETVIHEARHEYQIRLAAKQIQPQNAMERMNQSIFLANICDRMRRSNYMQTPYHFYYLQPLEWDAHVVSQDIVRQIALIQQTRTWREDAFDVAQQNYAAAKRYQDNLRETGYEAEERVAIAEHARNTGLSPNPHLREDIAMALRMQAFEQDYQVNELTTPMYGSIGASQSERSERILQYGMVCTSVGQAIQEARAFTLKREPGEQPEQEMGSLRCRSEAGIVTREERIAHTPSAESGRWMGERGNSVCCARSEESRRILERAGLPGIRYTDGMPDFSPLAEATVELGYMTQERHSRGVSYGRDGKNTLYTHFHADGTQTSSHRADPNSMSDLHAKYDEPGNFEQADILAAQMWTQQRKDEQVWTANDVKQYRESNGLTWHERNDMVTMDLVSTAINNDFNHLGGVAEIKARNRIVDDINRQLGEYDDGEIDFDSMTKEELEAYEQESLRQMEEYGQGAHEKNSVVMKAAVPGKVHDAGQERIEVIPAAVIQGVNSRDRYFWNHHNNTRQDYLALASRIDGVRDRLNRGETLEQIVQDPQLRDTVQAYFDPKHMIRVERTPEGYEFQDDGRHRIAAARELGLSIPVIVVDRYPQRQHSMESVSDNKASDGKAGAVSAGLHKEAASAAFMALAAYMSAHNYGRMDYAEYSRDPEWQHLHEAVYGDHEDYASISEFRTDQEREQADRMLEENYRQHRERQAQQEKNARLQDRESAIEQERVQGVERAQEQERTKEAERVLQDDQKRREERVQQAETARHEEENRQEENARQGERARREERTPHEENARQEEHARREERTPHEENARQEERNRREERAPQEENARQEERNRREERAPQEENARQEERNRREEHTPQEENARQGDQNHREEHTPQEENARQGDQNRREERPPQEENARQEEQASPKQEGQKQDRHKQDNRQGVQASGQEENPAQKKTQKQDGPKTEDQKQSERKQDNRQGIQASRQEENPAQKKTQKQDGPQMAGQKQGERKRDNRQGDQASGQEENAAQKKTLKQDGPKTEDQKQGERKQENHNRQGVQASGQEEDLTQKKTQKQDGPKTEDQKQDEHKQDNRQGIQASGQEENPTQKKTQKRDGPKTEDQKQSEHKQDNRQGDQANGQEENRAQKKTQKKDGPKTEDQKQSEHKQDNRQGVQASGQEENSAQKKTQKQDGPKTEDQKQSERKQDNRQGVQASRQEENPVQKKTQKQDGPKAEDQKQGDRKQENYNRQGDQASGQEENLTQKKTQKQDGPKTEDQKRGDRKQDNRQDVHADQQRGNQIQKNAQTAKQTVSAMKPQAPVIKTAEPTVKTTAPTMKPNTPTIKPNTPTMRPNTPTVKPNAPTMKPNTPTMRPNAPTIKPNTPTMRPNTPTVKPNAPTMRPSAPTMKPNTLTMGPNTPTVKPNTPTMMPNVPTAKQNVPTMKATKSAPAMKPNVPTMKAMKSAQMEKPNVPTVKAAKSSQTMKPNVPTVKAAKSSQTMKPNVPTVKATKSAQTVKPNVPAVKPNTQAMKQSIPVMKANMSAVKANVPAVKPAAPKMGQGMKIKR